MTQLLIARWTGEYPRNTDTEPAYDTEVRDDGGWLDPSTGTINLPSGDYLVEFGGICAENLAAATGRVYGAIGVTSYAAPPVAYLSRYRVDRDAGVLQPKFTVSGILAVVPPVGTTIMQLNTKCLYANTADVDWYFEVSVAKLN